MNPSNTNRTSAAPQRQPKSKLPVQAVPLPQVPTTNGYWDIEDTVADLKDLEVDRDCPVPQ